MSQTVQSIRSLSIQLNRAVSHNDMSNVVALDRDQDGIETGSRSTNFIATSSSKLGRLMGKKAGRVKELLLQNIGKAERTTDEMFKIYEENFYKQQSQAIKLQKEFKLYINAVASANEASKSLNHCIQQSTGEYQSARHDLVCENLSQLEHLQDDLMHKLRNQVLLNMNEYMSQFNELRNKIAKRHRKLIDFDSSRRVYELMLANVNKKRLQMQQQHSQPDRVQQRSTFRNTFFSSSSNHISTDDPIQSATNQLVDEARLLKLREQYNYCKVMYETINSELHEELPTVYEKKMKHLLDTLQNFFTIETQYHSNTGKLFATAADVIDELPMSIIGHRESIDRASGFDGRESAINSQSQPTSVEVEDYGKAASGSSGVGSSRGDSSHESSSSPDSSTSDNEDQPECKSINQEDDEDDNEDADCELEGQMRVRGCEDEGRQIASECPIDVKPESEEFSSPAETIIDTAKIAPQINQNLPEESLSQPGKGSENPSANEVDGFCATSTDLSIVSTVEITTASTFSDPIEQLKPPFEEIDITKHEQVSEVGQVVPGYLYKVKTCYKYLAEDIDELCFEADETIHVIEFDSTDEIEDGWLMGIREVNGQRGLFPANFTRPF